MLRLFCFSLVFIFGLSCFSQDTTLIHKRFFKTQQVAMGSLGAWSAGNLMVSPLLSNNIFKSGSSLTSGDYFHQMNFDPVLVLDFLQFPFEFFVQNPGLEVESISLIEFVEEIIFEII